MDTITVILESLRVIIGFLLLLFIPGFALSLVIFPRFSDIGIVERLAYSTVLSIGSVIALVLFMDVVLGVDITPVNIIIGITVFSCFAFFEWLCMVLYRKSTFKDRLEPQLSADYQKVQSYYTREMNAARDRFRQDTRTVVMYHEHQQSGLNHINHSYLLDVGEEIAIQQVIENKVKVTDSVILQPPYPKTRYFELLIREYNGDGLSLVDDLQIYPALVTKKPDRAVLGFVLQRGPTHITERIHKKTSTTEVEWIYSHDFHIFAIIHTEDTLVQMVDRILGKLDEITLSLRGGIHISSHAEDRQILKDAFDAVIIEKPRAITAKPQEIAQLPEVQFSAELWEIPKRPVIQTGAEPKEIPKTPEVLTDEVLIEIPRRPVIQTGAEPKEIPKTPEVLTDEVLIEIPKRQIIQTGAEPKKNPKRQIVQIVTEPKEIPKPPAVQSRVETIEIPKRPVFQAGAESKVIPMPPDVQTRVETIEIPKRQIIQAESESKEIPKPQEVLMRVELKELPEPSDELEDFELKEIKKHPTARTGSESTQMVRPPEIQFSVELKKIFRQGSPQHTVEKREIQQRPEVPIRIEPKAREQRKLQKEILRDLDVFSITPDSFGKSKKNIENIIIPKKSDVPKKLAEIKEDKDIDWLDLNWLYEE
jgi:hypothetical protein